MSIRDEIKYRVGECRLAELRPAMIGDPVRRHMFVSSEIQELLDGPWPFQQARKRCFELQAELETFVRGDQIGICLEPYKAGKAEFGRLNRPADEVWDFRAVKEPGLRIFGRFAEKDIFIALTCWPRSRPLDWIGRPPLLHAYSREFRDAIEGCKAEWRKLFHTYLPISGGHASDYVSENFVVIGN